jgi:hypothetical protein
MLRNAEVSQRLTIHLADLDINLEIPKHTQKLEPKSGVRVYNGTTPTRLLSGLALSTNRQVMSR